MVVDGKMRGSVFGLEVAICLYFIKKGVDKELKLLLFHDDELVAVLFEFPSDALNIFELFCKHLLPMTTFIDFLS